MFVHEIGKLRNGYWLRSSRLPEALDNSLIEDASAMRLARAKSLFYQTML